MKLTEKMCVKAVLMVLVLCVWLGGGVVLGDVTLPHVIGSHMVLQCDMPVKIWGWADVGEEVEVAMRGREGSIIRKAETVADDDGEWRVELDAMEAGGPFEMVVRGKNGIELEDVLVGEVWFCSGQSNMRWTVYGSSTGDEDIPKSSNEKIRLFRVATRPGGYPQRDTEGEWQVCGPDTVGSFSGVGYYFGRTIQRELGVGVGLIQSAWGGTRIEPWTPLCGFDSVEKEDVREIAAKARKENEKFRAELPERLVEVEEWIVRAMEELGAGKAITAIPVVRHPLNSHRSATGLYNGMVHPVVGFGIRGALWYQGEANHSEGMLYYHKMRALIGGWREVWGQGDFPFYYVQLAPYRYRGEDKLPKLWEAQTAAMGIVNTGMAVTTDIVGNVHDIHPKNKVDVGKRLALWALAKDYGFEGLVYSGPIYKGMKIEDGKIRLTFDYVGGGLASRDGEALSYFVIAGADKVFVEARAVIDGDSVVVWSDEVEGPVAVRFGWDELAEPNFMNKEGLPASPFRTDRW